MSRFTGPRLKVVRRFGGLDLPGLTRKRPKNTNPPGVHGAARKKKSEYAIRLEEKQKVRFNYGVTEKQMVRYMKRARRSKGSTGLALLQMLEMRLDCIAFRLGMAPTIPAARQAVNHGHICVNGRKVSIPSYECKAGDVITVRDNTKSRKLIADYAEYPGLFLPDYLEFDKDALKGKIKELPPREAVCAPVNELLVVEYYSRKI
ncbi:30S ribosomal protein S4 [Synechococcus sp. PCC 7336]|uniref:30S ribosomal protein S4 n=1 Tax=Synechococcus sp. PCC 7336 TaxID=195250 RepID=UPI00034A7493|nr:30S ribosomal protein S4 [Synechococcus sp. PCC 7336]